MAKEIERKFLVCGDFMPYVTCEHRIRQGYLNTDPDRTVRIRVLDSQGFITVKTRNTGCSRNEWEYEIPLHDAEDMLEACRGRIDKIRKIVPAGNGLRWEVDVFGGRHEGLVIAEIELPSEDTPFDRPGWLGAEVSGDPRYYNSSHALD